jgi:hypothetical protein
VIGIQRRREREEYREGERVREREREEYREGDTVRGIQRRR